MIKNAKEYEELKKNTSKLLDKPREGGYTLRQWYKDYLGIDNVDALRDKVLDFYSKAEPSMFAKTEDGDFDKDEYGYYEGTRRGLQDIEKAILEFPWNADGITFADVRNGVKATDALGLVAGTTDPENFYVISTGGLNMDNSVSKTLKDFGVDESHFKEPEGKDEEILADLGANHLHADDTAELGDNEGLEWTMFAERLFPGALDNWLDSIKDDENYEEVKNTVDKYRDHYDKKYGVIDVRNDFRNSISGKISERKSEKSKLDRDYKRNRGKLERQYNVKELEKGFNEKYNEYFNSEEARNSIRKINELSGKAKIAEKPLKALEKKIATREDRVAKYSAIESPKNSDLKALDTAKKELEELNKQRDSIKSEADSYRKEAADIQNKIDSGWENSEGYKEYSKLKQDYLDSVSKIDSEVGSKEDHKAKIDSMEKEIEDMLLSSRNIPSLDFNSKGKVTESKNSSDSNDSEEVKDNPLKEMPVDDGEVSDDVADMDDIVEDDVEPAPEEEDLLSQEEVDELLKDVPRGNKDETIDIPEEEEDLSDEDIEKGVSSIEDSLDAASDIPAPDLATDEEVEAEDPEIKSSVSGLMDKLHLDKDKESKTKAEEDFENLANATPDPDPTDEDNVSYGKDETTMNTGEHIPDDDDSENLPAINAPMIRPTTQPDEYVPQQEEPAEKPNDDILDVEYSVEDLKPAEVPEEPQPEEPVEEKPKKEKKGSNALSDFLKSGIRDTSIDIDSSGEKYTPTKTTDPVVQVSDKKTKDYVRSNWDTPDSCLASDERLKKLFGDDDSIALIAKINSYDFKYKPEFQKAMGLDGDKHRGVIAQEVEANPAFEGCVGELENGTKVLKIPELTASNTAAVGDLAKRVEQLTDLVLEMKNMLGDRG